MTTNNPFRKHANSLFASRGCDIDEALSYAQDIISGMPTGGAEALTAMMVIINTAANAFDQAQGPSPEKLAVQDMVATLVAAQVEKIEQRINYMIDDWMADNLSDRMDDHLDDKIRDWMNDNLEGMMEGEALCEAIRDAFRNNLTLSIC